MGYGETIRNGYILTVKISQYNGKICFITQAPGQAVEAEDLLSRGPSFGPCRWSNFCCHLMTD